MTEVANGCDTGLFPAEDGLGTAWDPLREQDWQSLSSNDNVYLDVLAFEHSIDVGEGDGCAHGDPWSAHLRPKVALQFSPVAIDAVGDCFWDNIGFTPGSSLPNATKKQFLSGPLEAMMRGSQGAREAEPASRQQERPQPQRPLSMERVVNPEPVEPDLPNPATSGLRARNSSGRVRTVKSMSEDVGAEDAGRHHSSGEFSRSSSTGTTPETPSDGNDTAMFLAQLFVTAIADGPILRDTPEKTLGVLEQVRNKVSKEQNTVVQLKNEGCVDLKMRVFVSNSIEAGAVSDYMTAHPVQVPAPFVVLSRNLCMGVTYDPTTMDPSVASVADRLRKQVKTYAVKVLREAIADNRCNLTTAELRGHRGAKAPAHALAPLLAERTVVIEGDPRKRYIVIPAKSKIGQRESSSPAQSPRPSPRPRSFTCMPPPTLDIPASYSPDTSAPSTPCSRFGDEDMDDGQPTAYFPVNLFVTAIADGELASDTPHKVHERLSQIVRKVPKEQNTSVEVCEGNTIDLKMRVFVVNSEDAKAVGDYIGSHMQQHPAPFVVLARHLPMAVLYDPNTLDLSDASVADRLRKQAKTRAVKVLRESIANKSLGVSMSMLRGHHGPLQPAERLQSTLSSLTQPFSDPDGDIPPGNYIVFAARNKATSVQCSPRKRASAASDHVDGKGRPGSSQRRSGASSASHLHRGMFDKALKKAKISYEGEHQLSPRGAPSSPRGAPLSPRARLGR